MKKLMKAVVGDPKTASPAKKYAAYALFVTVVAFVVALVILIVSSIAFSVADGKNAGITPSGDDIGEDLGGVTVNKSTITYDTSVTTDELDAMVGKIVKVADIRTKLDTGANDHYYAKNDSDGEDKLNAGAAEALDDFLIAFHTEKKADLIVDTTKADCNIPLVSETGADGYTFKLIVFHNNADISSEEYKATYQWIFDKAHSYGFIYTGNSFRYVGVAAATYMKNNAKTVKDYSEFVNVLKSSTKNNVSVTVGKTSYQMYYLAADGELKVPTNYVYTVIADGTNGYIITVDMSQKITATTTDTDGGVG